MSDVIENEDGDEIIEAEIKVPDLVKPVGSEPPPSPPTGIIDPESGEVIPVAQLEIKSRLIGNIWRVTERIEKILKDLDDTVLSSEEMTPQQRLSAAKNMAGLCVDSVKAYRVISGEGDLSEDKMLHSLANVVAEMDKLAEKIKPQGEPNVTSGEDAGSNG